MYLKEKIESIKKEFLFRGNNCHVLMEFTDNSCVIYLNDNSTMKPMIISGDYKFVVEDEFVENAVDKFIQLLKRNKLLREISSVNPSGKHNG